MYPLVKDKLKETEKRIRLSEIDLTKYLCQECNEYYEVYIPLLLNGLPICPLCWYKKENEETHTEN